MSTAGGSTSTDEGHPLKTGAIYGAGAWLVGYAVFALLVTLLESTRGFDQDWHVLTGWVHQNAHFVDLQGEVRSYNLLHDGDVAGSIDWAIPPLVYTLLVVLLMVLAGWMLVENRLITGSDEAIVGGATIALGYLPLTVLGTMLFEAGGLSADAASAALLMGIALPAMLGAAGGLIAAR